MRADRARAVEGVSPHRPRLRHGRRRHHAADGRQSPKEARHILDCMKYHPEGKRGVALRVAHDDYDRRPVPKKLAAANERTTLFCQIETAEGVEERRCHRGRRRRRLPVGRAFRSHRSRSAFPASSTIRNSPRRSTRWSPPPQAQARRWAAWCRRSSTGIDFYKRGFDFICYSGDVWVLQNALAEAVTQLRAGCKKRGLSDGRQVPRRAVGRFQEGGRLADLPGFRRGAAADGAGRRGRLSRERAIRSAPSRWPISMR